MLLLHLVVHVMLAHPGGGELQWHQHQKKEDKSKVRGQEFETVLGAPARDYLPWSCLEAHL